MRWDPEQNRLSRTLYMHLPPDDLAPADDDDSNQIQRYINGVESLHKGTTNTHLSIPTLPAPSQGSPVKRSPSKAPLGERDPKRVNTASTSAPQAPAPPFTAPMPIIQPTGSSTRRIVNEQGEHEVLDSSEEDDDPFGADAGLDPLKQTQQRGGVAPWGFSNPMDYAREYFAKKGIDPRHAVLFEDDEETPVSQPQQAQTLEQHAEHLQGIEQSEDQGFEGTNLNFESTEPGATRLPFPPRQQAPYAVEDQIPVVAVDPESEQRHAATVTTQVQDPNKTAQDEMGTSEPSKTANDQLQVVAEDLRTLNIDTKGKDENDPAPSASATNQQALQQQSAATKGKPTDEGRQQAQTRPAAKRGFRQRLMDFKAKVKASAASASAGASDGHPLDLSAAAYGQLVVGGVPAHRPAERTKNAAKYPQGLIMDQIPKNVFKSAKQSALLADQDAITATEKTTTKAPPAKPNSHPSDPAPATNNQQAASTQATAPIATTSDLAARWQSVRDRVESDRTISDQLANNLSLQQTYDQLGQHAADGNEHSFNRSLAILEQVLTLFLDVVVSLDEK